MIVEKVVDEMRSKPFTMLLMLGLYTGGGILWVNSQSHAGTSDLQALKSEVAEIKHDLNKASLEQQLRSVRSELFSLQRTVEELKASRQAVPKEYAERLDTLVSDEDTLSRKLNAIYNAEAAKERGR